MCIDSHIYLLATTTSSKSVTIPTIPAASVTSSANVAASTAIPANPSTAIPVINTPNNG